MANLGASYVIPVALIILWLAVLLGLPAYLPLQWASWITFLALMITPGYLLGEILGWRLRLDVLERLALAFSLGMAVLAIPGLITDVLHLTVTVLTIGWIVISGLVIFAWLVLGGIRLKSVLGEPGQRRWAVDEMLMLLLLGGAFAVMMPLLQIFRLDGDSYSFIAFVRDALAGLPILKYEPYFGTQTPATVRLVFDQVVSMTILWTQFSQQDQIQLAATAARPMIAVWSILATYMLAKTAGRGSRRLGLLAAGVQVIVYLAAPFLRIDNVSSFFFNRITTDKFMVPVVILPVVMALAIRFVRDGERPAWVLGALATFAVSAIHPLIAFMLALGLGAFGGLHLLLNLRSRVAWRRILAIGVLLGILAAIPGIQFVIARFQTPFAPTYPDTLDGWQIGQKMTPVLPFTLMRGLDQYAPLPTLDNVTADQALTNTSPFLVWRFASNMRQERIVLFGSKRYILDPSYVLEPPYILAFILLFFLLPRLKRSLAVQYVVSNVLIVLFVMYNPILTPIIGAQMVPWIMWRIMWMMPYALTIALGLYWVVDALGRAAARVRGAPARSGREPGRAYPQLAAFLLPAILIAAAAALLPNIEHNVSELKNASQANAFPTPTRILARLDQETALGPDAGSTVVADQAVSVVVAGYAAKANVLAHRALTTSEAFPAAQQDVALQRLIDQYTFFRAHFITDATVSILKKYDARYVITSSGSDLDLQLRTSSQWFEWQLDDQGYSLYAVRQMPVVTESIQGNMAMEQRQWAEAQSHFEAALKQNSADTLALFGLAEAYRVQGQFDQALQTLLGPQVPNDSLVLHYELGRLYSQTGDLKRSIAELRQVQAAAPDVDRFHQAMGDVCLADGQVDCAQLQYNRAAAIDWPSNEAQRLLVTGSTWLARDRIDLGIPLYVKAAAVAPSKDNRLILANAYQSVQMYDKAQAVLDALQAEYPSDDNVLAAMAQLAAVQGQTDRAGALYDGAIRLEELKLRDTTQTRLAKAQVLIGHDQEAARQAIADVLNLQPYNASAYTLLGNLYRTEQQPDMAIIAYQKALKLNPTEVAAYISLSGEYSPQAAATLDPVNVLQQGAQVNPLQVSLFLQMGDQLQRRGDAQEAVSSYQLALQLLDPQQFALGRRDRRAAGTRALAYIRLANVYEDLGDAKTALNYYYAATGAAPFDAGARVALGDALRRRGDTAGANQAYTQAIKTTPSYVDAYIRLGSLLSAQGNSAQVQALYNQALDAARASQDKREEARILLGVGRNLSQSRQPQVGLDSADAPILTADSGTLDPATESALTAYNDALQADQSLATATALAQLYQQMGQPEKGIQLFREQIQEGLTQNWTVTRLSRYYTGLGNAYQVDGQLDMARRAFARAITLDGWSPTPRVQLADVLTQQGDRAGALAQLRQAVEVAPGSVQAQVALANALSARGQQDEALKLFQSAYDGHPGDLQASLALGSALQQRADWAGAEQIYRRTIAQMPGEAQAYVGLAGLYEAKGQLQDAEATLRQGLGADRSQAATYVNLGDLLSRSSRYDDAIAVYSQALQSSVSDYRIYTGLANAQLGSGRVPEAISSLEKAAGLNLRSPQPLLQLAAIYQEQGQFAQAEQILSQAAQRSARDVGSRIALANLYKQQGMNDEALIQLRSAVRENPDSIQAQVALGNTLVERGRLADADTLYQRAESSGAADAAGYRALALARGTEGKLDDALVLIDRALALAPSDPAAWMAKGQLLAQRGDQEGALVAYRQATSVAPGQGRTWHALGDALAIAGKSQEAAQAYQQAIAVEPSFLPSYSSLADLSEQLGESSVVSATLIAARQAVPGSYLPYLFQANHDETALNSAGAQAAYEEAITRAPGVLESYLGLGDLLLRQGRFQDAIANYNQALDSGLADYRLYLGVASASNALGQNDQVPVALRKAASVSATSPLPLVQLATFDRQQNHPEQAEQALLRALERFPGNFTVRSSLSALYQSMGRTDDSLTQLKVAVVENPDSIEARVAYAQALRLEGQATEAQAVSQGADELAARQAQDYRSKVQSYQAQGRLSDALAAINLATTIAPGEAMNWMIKGQVETLLGDQQAALAAYQQATHLNARDGRTWHAYGRALLAVGRNEDAARALSTAIAVEPSYLPPYASLYQAYRLLGRQDQADEVVRRAQQLVPGSYLPDVYVARSLGDHQKWDEARQMLDQARKKAPGMIEPLLALAGLEQLRGDQAQAVAAYRQAVDLRPGDRTAYLALIDYQLQQAENDQALATAKQALVPRPGDPDLLILLGRAQQARGDLSAANATFAKAASLSPYDGQPFAELGALDLFQGRPQDAIAAYQQAVGAQPQQASYSLDIAQVWVSLARSDEAIQILETALPRVSRPAAVYAALSTLYLQQNKPDLALQRLQQGLQKQADDPQLLLALASYYRSRADSTNAEKIYQRALELYPGDFTVRAATGDFYQSRGRISEALAEYQQAVALQASRTSGYLALGDAQTLVGDSSQASATYAQALTLSPAQEDVYANLAGLYRQQGKYDQAQATYEQGLAAVPASTKLMSQYATLLLQLGDADRGLALANQAVQLSPTAATLVARANFNRQLNRLDDAQQDLEAALQVAPGSIDALLALGAVYQARGDVDNARSNFQRAVDIAPGVPTGYVGLGDLAALQGRQPDAQRYYQAAEAVQPGSSNALLHLAAAQTAWGDPAGAIASYRRALAVSPLTVEGYVGLARLQQQQTGDLSTSLGYLSQAQKLGVQQGQVYRAIGDLYLAAGQPGKALANYQAAIKREPSAIDGYLGMATYYLAVGLPGDAVRNAQQAVTMAPRSGPARIALGNAYWTSGDIAKARSSFQAAINLDPAQVGGYTAIASLAAAQKQYSDAIAAYQQAIRVAPLNSSLYVGMGGVYAQAQQYANAYQAFDRAAALNPALPDPWLAKGDAYQAQGDLASAQAAFQKAQSVRPRDPVPLLRMAGLAITQQDYGSAARLAQQAIGLNSRLAAAYTVLGTAQANMGQQAEAISSFATALKLDPRQTGAYSGWIRQQLGQDGGNPNTGQLQAALAAVAGGPDAGSMWAQVLLGMGYDRLDRSSGKGLPYLQKASSLDPAYADLYQALAGAYEGTMLERPAVAAWYRFIYAAGQRTDTTAARARLNWLLNGRITRPAEGATVSGDVQVTGTAARENFWYYKLEFKGPGADWTQIGDPIYQPVTNGLLLVWHTAGLPRGQYQLRLTVIDNTGNYGPYDVINVKIR